MIAVDTNILVRLITRDDPAQAAIADRIMSRPVLVPLTVLLELAWVLGGNSFRFDRATLATALRHVVDLATVTMPAEDQVRWAIERFAGGADIADMIHIAASGGASAFVSFEDKLEERAGPVSPLPVEKPA